MRNEIRTTAVLHPALAGIMRSGASGVSNLCEIFKWSAIPYCLDELIFLIFLLIRL